MPFGRKTRSQKSSKFIFFVFPHCVPASLFIFFTLCRLAEKQDRKIAGDHLNSFSLYFLILSLLAFLCSLLGAVCHSETSPLHIAPPPPRACDLEITSSRACPLTYSFTVCRLSVFCFHLTLCRQLLTNSLFRAGHTEGVWKVTTP